MKKFLYIHGFNGSPSSKTKLELERLLNLDIECIQLDHSKSPRQNFILISSWISELLLDNNPENLVIIGNSAGGFWANYFSRSYGTHLILINPSLNPQESFKKYFIPKEILSEYSHFQVNKQPISHKVYIGELDMVVDNSDIDLFFTNVQYLPNEGHRVEDLSQIVEYINDKF